MNRQGRNEVYGRAKQMIIAGESWEKIMEETKLRLKDLKKIQMTEIDPKF